MIRHFAEKIRGEKFTAFPGDDLSIPNMILCYRRRLLAGETAEFQITNIPDQSPERSYNITLTLTDTNGKIIKKFAGKTLKSTECKDVTFTVPAAELRSKPSCRICAANCTLNLSSPMPKIAPPETG